MKRPSSSTIADLIAATSAAAYCWITFGPATVLLVTTAAALAYSWSRSR